MDGEKVLVVDDHKDSREFLIEYILKPNGYVPILARDGLEAMEMVREYSPDVILLDVEMPRMDGLTFLKKIMHYHPLPVIIVSSLTPRGSKMALQALARRPDDDDAEDSAYARALAGFE